jgi:para-aminobenzoate synthetase
MMRCLLIDNYDSYTYNLYQLIATITGEHPLVLANDDAALGALDDADTDAIVISPGPGRPQRHRDLGLALDVLERTTLPVLGVCLGHQAIAWMEGAVVEPAPVARHGYLETVRHHGDSLFTSVDREFRAVRYHSFRVAEPLPPSLVPIAWAEDGVLMAFRHRSKPRWGVQFHPESAATEFGRTIIENFLGGAGRRPTRRHGPIRQTAGQRNGGGKAAADVTTNGTARDDRNGSPRQNGAWPATTTWAVKSRPATGTGWSLATLRIDTEPDPLWTFEQLFQQSPNCFWLDSSMIEPGLSRFSYLGAPDGAYGETLQYRQGERWVIATRNGGEAFAEPGGIYEVLNRRISQRSLAPTDLPFDLTAGYVGYFGYELQPDAGMPPRQQSGHPDSCWMAASRMVVLDHLLGTAWIVALLGPDPAANEANQRWVEQTGRRLEIAPRRHETATGTVAALHVLDPRPWLLDSQEAYLDKVIDCKKELLDGESYEICLTTELSMPFHGAPFQTYRRLRALNPAPYSAYICFGALHILCSSPERFLTVGRSGVVESRPIKGTTRRDDDPRADRALRDELAASQKNRAENLMIVDLIRNDIGQVCDAGSVSVPHFMEVKSYATVHQLVSTIQGRLRDDVTAVDAAQACFPGGSMTGAPKRRTMEILDRLERRPRGIYSGALGFFGLAGEADLNIVIRTAVVRDGTLTAGAGGAIVLDSDPSAEYDEMLLKMMSSLRAVEPHPSAAPDVAAGR